MQKLVSVLLPLPLDRAFDYTLPDNVSELPLGQLVQVSFRNKLHTGVVWHKTDDPINKKIKYKPIKKIYDYPPLEESLVEYIAYLSRYYLTPLGLALKLAFSGAGDDIANIEQRTAIHYRLAGTLPEKISDKQKAVVEVLSDTPSLPLGELAESAMVGTGVVKTMLKNNILVAEEVEISQAKKLQKISPPDLTETQNQVMQEIAKSIGGGFKTFCLHGVTGSGKSEVYFHLIEKTLAQGQNVLVLLPEIALTKQWQKQFLARFDEAPFMWHSSLTTIARKRIWQDIAKQKAKFVVGARSALALPLHNIGLIVVDEEHDAGYKQEENANYHARDMAVLRAKLSDCPIVLATATPSLETYHNIKTGKYTECLLPDRIGSGGFADVKLVDLVQERLPTDRWISQPLRDAIKKAYDDGKQSLLYLNRRGYAPMTLCRACGHRLQCPNCSVWLVHHKRQELWRCHHCDYSVRLDDGCPSCDEEDSLTACGPGVERLMEEVQSLFPDARLAEMTSDSMGSVEKIEAFISAMTAGDIDIIVGTQLIAKGYHFPSLTVVGVIDADMGLGGGELRSNERVFQLLQQVAGRAGRGADKGEVFLQTTQPDNIVVRAIADNSAEDFYEAEWASRRAFGMPPWGRLASVIVSSDDADSALAAATAYVREAHVSRPAGIEVLGPIPAPLAVLRGRYRYRVLLKCAEGTHPQSFLRAMVPRFEDSKLGVRFRIDIDPINFY